MWAPGQYVELFAPSAPDLPLPYSIASAPDVRAPGEFELAIGTGSGRELLAPLPVGSELLLAGPFGRMIWSPAGELGAPRRRGHGRRAATRPPASAPSTETTSRRSCCSPGLRGQADILWRLEFEALARRYERFRYLCSLTQPDETWSGLRGRVQEHVVSLARGLRDPRRVSLRHEGDGGGVRSLAHRRGRRACRQDPRRGVLTVETPFQNLLRLS